MRREPALEHIQEVLRSKSATGRSRIYQAGELRLPARLTRGWLSSDGPDPRGCAAMSSIPFVRQGAACGSRDRGRGGSPLPMCGRKPPRRCSRRGSRCNRGHRRDSRDDGRTPCPSRSTLTSRPRTKSSEIATCYSGVIVLPLILVPQDLRTLMRIESTFGSPRRHSELPYRQGTCREFYSPTPSDTLATMMPSRGPRNV